MATGEAQLLARLPPLKKMGPIQVFHSRSAFNPLHRSLSHEPKLATLSDEQVKESILNDFFQVSKRAKFRTIIAGFILPPALVAEIYVPFTFEIALIYFIIQLKAWRTARFLLSQNTRRSMQSRAAECELENGKVTGGLLQVKIRELAAFQKISEQMYHICSKIDPLKFPSLEDNTLEIDIENEEINHDIVCQKIATSALTTHQFPPAARLKTKSDTIKSVPEPDSKTVTKTWKSILRRDSDESKIAGEEDVIKHESQIATSRLDSIKGHLLARNKSVNQPKSVPNTEIASALIKLFQEVLPLSTSTRHEVNSRRVAEDFNRALKIRTMAYTRSILANSLTSNQTSCDQ
ncbi:hypothetical protein PGTUg99_026593 [Puccinia graminis f. sp. tritici]|nr:hypothetical protein PGTUg99_026593 [Puccinia graminis f. sp. tritici]